MSLLLSYRVKAILIFIIHIQLLNVLKVTVLCKKFPKKQPAVFYLTTQSSFQIPYLFFPLFFIRLLLLSGRSFVCDFFFVSFFFLLLDNMNIQHRNCLYLQDNLEQRQIFVLHAIILILQASY